MDENKEEPQDTSRGSEGRYCLVPTLIALIFLSQGNAENKAKAIGELFSEHSFFQPGITNVNKDHLEVTL